MRQFYGSVYNFMKLWYKEETLIVPRRCVKYRLHQEDGTGCGFVHTFLTHSDIFLLDGQKKASTHAAEERNRVLAERMNRDNLTAVIAGILRNGHIMRVAFLKTTGCNLHKASMLAQLLQILGTEVAHTGA